MLLVVNSHPLHAPCACAAADFDRRFCTFEYPVTVAHELRRKFHQQRKKNQPVVRACLAPCWWS